LNPNPSVLSAVDEIDLASSQPLSIGAAYPADAWTGPSASPSEADGTLRLTALVGVQRRLASFDGSIDELAALVPGFALEAIDATGAAFELFEDGALVAKAASPALQACIGTRLPLEASLSGEAIRTNRTLSCPDAKHDPRIATSVFERFGLRSVIVSVVHGHQGRAIGALLVAKRDPCAFRPEDACLLELLADAIGAAIHRKQSTEESERTLRIQAGVVRLQQAIAASEADLKTVLDLIAVHSQALTGAAGAAVLMIEGSEMVYRAAAGTAQPHLGLRIPRAASLTGLAAEQMEVLICDDTAFDRRVNREACALVGARSLLTVPMKSEGRAAGALLVMSGQTRTFGQREVGTLQILAEWLGLVIQRDAIARRLQTSEAKYRLAFESNPFPMWIYDEETLRFLAVNDAAVAEYGYSAAEFLSMTIWDIRPPSASLLLDTHLRGSDTVSVSRPWQHRRKDGSIIEAEISGAPIQFDARAARLILAVDVTDRDRTARQLIESAAVMAIAGRVARVAGWSFDLKKRSFTYSDELCAMHDLPAKTPVSLKQALNHYAPECRPAINAAVENCAKYGTPYDLELDLVTAKGRRISVRTIGQPVRNASGEIIGTQGAVQDISERVAEEAARRAEAMRFHIALDNISQGVCFFDGRQHLLLCNQRYAEMYRLGADQVRKGTTLARIVEARIAAGTGPAEGAQEYLARRESVAQSQGPSVTVVALTDGRRFRIHHQPMPDGGWVATHEDLTARASPSDEAAPAA
jgi:PAS domain S-box-containing protein